MESKDLQYVADVVEMEGFDYAFRDYSNFEDVQDEKFHELRRAYIKAANALENYLPDLDDVDEDGDEDEDF